MRQRWQRAPIGTAWTTGATGNTGDAIAAGEAAGAALDLMDDAWRGPAIPLPGGPYFCLAERSLPGCILVSSKGGLVTDERARVLRGGGTPISGLYAAGSTSAAVMGSSYAGAGAAIGPAMTFGYLAALDLAGRL